jgi:hypothetical protein
MSKNVVPKREETDAVPECFVLMPIADHSDYPDGHFRKVYEDIFQPACNKAGYKAIRADDVLQTNFIHLDILQKLIDSPMAICDLSSRNPNVLFELGLRQAFDKPTVLVQNIGTPKIFDISLFRYTEYDKELKYRDVLSAQNAIAESIIATREATEKGDGINSIVRIMSLVKPAALTDNPEDESIGLLQLIRAEMSDLRSQIKQNNSTSNYMKLRPNVKEAPEFNFNLAFSYLNALESIVTAEYDDKNLKDIEGISFQLGIMFDETKSFKDIQAAQEYKKLYKRFRQLLMEIEERRLDLK